MICVGSDPRSASFAGEYEVHANLGAYRNRFSVLQVGFVARLLHGVDRCRHQYRMSTHRSDILDRAIFCDVGIENHHSLNVALAGQNWINGRSHLNEEALGGFFGEANPLRGCRFTLGSGMSRRGYSGFETTAGRFR